ncbi:MAG: hypothetical protein ACD_57C00192G0004 [uncultured bacterium]|uniref:Single-stranded DNA-binding protein n=1 Tax=Candidatus Curtissbacteria bacterium RIFOXYA1_FULL_41_14 TaxID=1797737 RepID=A0A1F5HCV5_9BACT|nr:MAG: hypothetical protein ACD_57C00192G0004 [uncultured bacterium]KKR77299.1 MAG: Single-stranded DNA-binding protein [Candidatus Curtissbacteria bacterium GW2011_GWD1_40_8]OGD92308.1 MAG: hypothetical protein A3E14_02575 [Candidatus Curtissbacteria bacterium RIFCSPHIGHO2_12_FULL_41_13]OGE01920.1 MAG: hypothetical protein A2196_04905 [Candidatus Curtissbacteria bacterium RIFOXYA1_FULL_41_14]OGE11586.1 MAG: hypothetical protein A2470_02495 [Candidatus Curtissbacteria bacterium RIFOXYC2_FULL_4
MASRASLNKVLLIGNLTRDPELRYTPSGAAVCSFGLATNRVYVASDGTKKEEAEFIRIVSWNKLAELCSQLLSKGRKVYVEGRLQTRSWETPDGITKQTTEVVIDDMRILDSRRSFEEASTGENIPYIENTSASQTKVKEPSSFAKATEDKESLRVKESKGTKGSKEPKDSNGGGDEDKIDLDDLPF